MHENGITVSFVTMAQNIMEVILLLTIMNTHTIIKKKGKKPTHQNPTASSIYRSQAEYENLTGKSIILWMGIFIGKY